MRDGGPVGRGSLDLRRGARGETLERGVGQTDERSGGDRSGDIRLVAGLGSRRLPVPLASEAEDLIQLRRGEQPTYRKGPRHRRGTGPAPLLGTDQAPQREQDRRHEAIGRELEVSREEEHAHRHAEPGDESGCYASRVDRLDSQQ